MSDEFMALKVTQDKRRHAPFVRLLRALLFAWIGPVVWRAPRIEAYGPTIILCNHARYSDSIFLQIASRGRLTVCGAKLHYFDSWKENYFLGLLNVIPVAGREQFVDDCCRLLGQGRPILIYPEMGRNPHGLGEFKDWFTEVIERSGAAVQVACLNKVYEPYFTLPSLRLKKIFVPGYLKKQSRAKVVALIRREMELLLIRA